MLDDLVNNLEDIHDEVMTKLIPENIKKNVTLLNVTGTLPDTSDATATAADIKAGKTAYRKGSKITGTLPEVVNPTSIDGTTNGSFFKPENAVSGNNKYGCYTVEDTGGGSSLGEQYLVNWVTVTNLQTWYINNQQKVKTGMPFSTVANTIGLTANKIKGGETILGITGTYSGMDAQQLLNTLYGTNNIYTHSARIAAAGTNYSTAISNLDSTDSTVANVKVSSNWSTNGNTDETVVLARNNWDLSTFGVSGSNGEKVFLDDDTPVCVYLSRSGNDATRYYYKDNTLVASLAYTIGDSSKFKIFVWENTVYTLLANESNSSGSITLTLYKLNINGGTVDTVWTTTKTLTGFSSFKTIEFGLMEGDLCIVYNYINSSNYMVVETVIGNLHNDVYNPSTYTKIFNNQAITGLSSSGNLYILYDYNAVINDGFLIVAACTSSTSSNTRYLGILNVDTSGIKYEHYIYGVQVSLPGTTVMTGGSLLAGNVINNCIIFCGCSKIDLTNDTVTYDSLTDEEKKLPLRVSCDNKNITCSGRLTDGNSRYYAIIKDNSQSKEVKIFFSNVYFVREVTGTNTLYPANVNANSFYGAKFLTNGSIRVDIANTIVYIYKLDSNGTTELLLPPYMASISSGNYTMTSFKACSELPII